MYPDQIKGEVKKDQVLYPADPLNLEIPDDVLVKNINSRIRKDVQWYDKEKNLRPRQEKNFNFWIGKQIDEDKLKVSDARYVDNLIYEGEGSIKPIAMSRMPDLLVTPAKDFSTSRQQADNLTKIINSDLRKRWVRKTLGIALKHIPIFFLGAIKVVWNPERGQYGDYEYVLVHPYNLVIDHTAPSNDVDSIDYICEYSDLTLKEILMRFPDKQANLAEALGAEVGDFDKEKNLASPIRIAEVWFTWYEKHEKEYRRIEAVAWKYKNTLLKKMKNPYWDWSGEQHLFRYDTAKKEKELLNEEEMRNMMSMNPNENMNPMLPASQQMPGMMPGMPMMNLDQMGITREEVFHNYFEVPRKPYILLGYDQMGAMPYDETSRIEQVRYLQENVNKRGKQITEIADEARARHIWSNDSGLEKKDIELFSEAEPGSGIITSGKPSDVHAFIVGEQPGQSLYEDQEINRGRVFEILGVHSTTRGKKETNVATTSQILREADYGRIDDYVEDTLNFAAEEMAMWAMQMIKLRYTQDHFRRILGQDGATTFYTVNRDIIDDGMEVIVSASGVDKMLRKRQAFDMAKMKLMDPLSFYQDIDVSNPKERTLRLMTFMADPNAYLQKYISPNAPPPGQSTMTPGQPTTTPGTNPVGGSPTGAGSQAAVQDLTLVAQGQQPQMTNIDQEYINTINAFLKSPDFKNLPPQLQARVGDFARQLIERVSQTGTPQPNPTPTSTPTPATGQAPPPVQEAAPAGGSSTMGA